eukprot:s1820_g10.t1
MAALTQLGYEVKWTGAGCSISAPDGAQLPVQLDQDVPHFLDKMDFESINKSKLSQNKGDPAEACSFEDGCETARQLSRSGCCEEVGGDLPADLVKEIPGYAEVDMNQVIFNRHQRRKVQRAKTLVVHLFSGDDLKFWMSQEKASVVVICV